MANNKGVVVITGASRGIGLATVKKFLENGWRVIGTSHQHPIPVENPELTKIVMDASSPGSIVRAMKEITDLGVAVDVLVNNAGVNLDGHSVAAEGGIVRKTLEVNVVGVVDVTEKLLPLMRKGGCIINIDSNYGSFSTPIDDETSSAYRISKAALNMYTRTLAFRLKDKGIVVSSLDPGWCRTDMGNGVASETEKPDREPEEAAGDIYTLAISDVESGCFWRFGKKRDW
jgi:NAD(P)-dependent dehydrogenase (short-subunit alcohol dehydrogenase family)